MGLWDGSGISWTTCKQSAPRSRQTTTPVRPDALPDGQPTVSEHWRAKAFSAYDTRQLSTSHALFELWSPHRQLVHVRVSRQHQHSLTRFVKTDEVFFCTTHANSRVECTNSQHVSKQHQQQHVRCNWLTSSLTPPINKHYKIANYCSQQGWIAHQ